MGTSEEGARVRIVMAVVSCIERDGLASLTVREIAKEADVNVAALNYYFGAKDDLVAQVLKDRLDHFVGDAIATLDGPEEPAERRVASALLYMLNGALDWPRLLQAIFVESAGDAAVGPAIRQTLGKVIKRIAELLSPGAPGAALARATGLVSAALMPAFVAGAFDKLPGLELGNRKRRGDYVDALLASPEQVLPTK
jgi:AcrR family transcriptional regulator